MGGKYTGLALMNFAPLTEFSTLIPKLVYNRYEIAPVLRVSLSTKFTNVEFRLGEIENLPVANNTADVIISNCVINLSPNKQRVFEEAYRVLKPNGRLMISDMVLLKEIPEAIAKSVEAYIGCIAGAEKRQDYLNHIKKAGFNKVEIVEETKLPFEVLVSDATAQQVIKQLKITKQKAKEIFDSVVSIKVTATKPNQE
jgi:SAM-dependent methyltransferase